MLAELLMSRPNAVVFTGAGMSAESGIPTFRSGADALWRNHRPEDLATPDAFARDPALVTAWYRKRRATVAAAAPNPGHAALAALATELPALLVVTQNVDGLHETAGSRDVVELHGSIRWSRCVTCGNRTIGRLSGPLPESCACGGLLRPDVVWFGEALPADEWERAMRATRDAAVFVVAGTSAAVYPAAGLVMLARSSGAFVAEINPEPTEATAYCDLTVRARVGEFFPMLLAGAREHNHLGLHAERRPATS